jgi:hypothetical protein
MRTPALTGVFVFLESATTGETYSYEPDMDEAAARGLWLAGPPTRASVAVDGDGLVLGQSLGFQIIGRVPDAFRHPTEGYVGLHVMYRRL